MYKKENIVTLAFTTLIILCSTQFDIFLLERAWIAAPPLLLVFSVLFLFHKNKSALTITLVCSFPFTLIFYHTSGMHLFFFIMITALHQLLLNSIHIKKTIPYFLLVSFLLLQELHRHFATPAPFNFFLFLQQLIIVAGLYFLISELYKKIEASFETSIF